VPEKLTEYRRKRDFATTAEPAGGKESTATGGLSRFVVQKHAASRLHYDFRLEIDGVLASWAVPKGPSLDPADKRLAVHVEDHPVEYFDFEGTIPKGEYGGGTVMVWDWGGVRWLPPHGSGSAGAPGLGDDPQAMVGKGDIKFELYGRKLQGVFALVGGRRGNDWLLIKKRDEAATPGEEVTRFDRSVLSGRTMDEIAAAAGRVWHSKESGKGASGGDGFVDLARAERVRMPATLEPMMAHPGDRPFNDPKWVFEPKMDGFRILALVRDGKVRLLSRRGGDATRQFPELQSLGELLRAGQAIIDGEVVAIDESGLPSFQLLQERTGWKGGRTAAEPHPSIPVVYYAFDLPYWEGFSLLKVPLSERRKLLGVCFLDGPNVRLLETFPGEVGAALFEAARKQGQEGVIAKQLNSAYTPGKRTRSWLKIKTIKEQACAIVGYTSPQGGRGHFGSLAVAIMERGKLAYGGQVGSGFDGALLKRLAAAMEPLRLKQPPKLARASAAPKNVTWVEPQLVCEVKYTEWTRDNVLRQPSFLRLRPDLTVEDCVREPAATG
jgi:bifunctional non-homologous end joining protein LigD